MKKGLNILKILAFSLTIMAFGAVCGEKFALSNLSEVDNEVVTEDEIIKRAAMNYFTYIDHLNMISASDLRRDLEEYYLIDIRRADDYNLGHIPGTINVAMPSIGKVMNSLPNDKPLIIICYSGEWAAQAAGVLRMADYDARILESGFNAWELAGYEIEK